MLKGPTLRSQLNATQSLKGRTLESIKVWMIKILTIIPMMKKIM
ncbi:MAG: hypothetical protein AAB693_01570 [Patescibacteria group bacterium]